MSDQPGAAASSRPHPASIEPDRLLEECEVRFARRSGPGGQHRNKVETAAILSHRPTGVSAEANERRSQQENRAVALQRLRVNLALETRCVPEPENSLEPSDLWRSRLKGGRIIVSPLHHDFASLLAEALDILQTTKFDAKAAAQILGCSTTQLVKFLKIEPRALKLLNDARLQEGLRPYL